MGGSKFHDIGCYSLTLSIRRGKTDKRKQTVDFPQRKSYFQGWGNSTIFRGNCTMKKNIVGVSVTVNSDLKDHTETRLMLKV